MLIYKCLVWGGGCARALTHKHSENTDYVSQSWFLQLSMFQVAVTFRVVVTKVECAIETLGGLVNTPISGFRFQGFKFRRSGMG